LAYLKDINDLGNIVLKTDNGTPVPLRRSRPGEWRGRLRHQL
jgi:hypothetical protein